MVLHVTEQYVFMAAGSVMESMIAVITVMRITAQVNYTCKAHAWLQMLGFHLKDDIIDINLNMYI